MAITIETLDRLKSQLLTSGIQDKNQALFQVINQLIDSVRQGFGDVNTQVFAPSGGGPSGIANQTFLTYGQDSATLPNSAQLIAGEGIQFNKNGNKLIISTGLTRGIGEYGESDFGTNEFIGNPGNTGSIGSLSGFTPGSVIFAGPTGFLAQDNSNFFWDDANNRLGIGTNAPSAPLEIQVPDIQATTGILASRILNPTAATAAIPRQFSPTLSFLGQAWDTSGGGASITQRVALYMRTLTGVDTAGLLAIADDSNGAGVLTDQFYIGSGVAGGTADFRIRDGNIVFRNAGRGIGFVTTPLTDTFNSNFAFSGDVSGGLNRIVFRTVPGFVFIEGNNSAAVPGVTPSMDFRNFDGSTAVPIVGIRHRATKGGGPTAGFGTRQQYQADSTTTVDQNQGAFDFVWSDPTHATRTAKIEFLLVNSAAAQALKFEMLASGVFYTSAATFMIGTRTAYANGAAANVGTLNNAPTAGDPTKWIPVDDNGTTRYIPAW